MAKEVATLWKVVVNNVNLSAWAFDVAGADEKEQIDVSGFTGYKEFVPGVREQGVTVQFVNDTVAGGPHATMEPLYRGGSVFPFYVQRHSDLGTSATNQIYGGTAQLYTYPFGATLNEREELSIEFRPANQSTWNWGTVFPPP
jgi:hypothetical protein